MLTEVTRCAAEGSKKTTKGAKGARFYSCTLPPSSCSLRAAGQLNLEPAARNRLTVYHPPAYSRPVAKKDATGFDSPNYSRRTTANGGIFTSVPCCAFNGAAVVGRLRPAGFLEYRSVNPVIRRSSPFDSGWSGSKPLLKEAHMPGTNTPVLPQSEHIRRLAGIAYTIGAMLGAHTLLPVSGQADALAVSATLASDLAQALATLTGEAA